VLLIVLGTEIFFLVGVGNSQPVDAYNPSGYNLIGATSLISGDVSNLALNDNSYMTFRGYLSAFSTTTNSRAFIGYRSNTGTSSLSSPKNRSWNSTAWDSSETEMASAGSSVRLVRVAYSPVAQYYNYKIVAVLSDDGTLDAYVYNGTSWKVSNNLADLWSGAPGRSERPFDVAFSTTSGEALLVYAWYDDVVNDLAYRRWFASNQSWSVQMLLDDTTQGFDADYSFVILSTDPTSNSDYIGAIALDRTNDDVVGWTWNGASFGNQTQLTGTVSANDREAAGIAFDHIGKLMAVAGEGSNEVIRWNQWTKAGGWGTSQATSDIDSAEARIPYYITLKADPATDDLMLTLLDDGNDIHSLHWNGASWTIYSNQDAAADDQDRRCVDFEWEPTGSKGIQVRGTTPAQITWRTWTTGAGWGADNNSPMGTNPHHWVQLRRNQRNVNGDVKILGVVLEDSAFDLGATKWDGTTFTVIGSSTFTADTTTNTYESFDLEFQILGDPIESASEVEFTGTSNTDVWSQVVWTVDSAWDTANIIVIMQLYNWNTSSYPASGDGYIAYTSSATPNTDENQTKTITNNPQNYRDASGNWKIKIKGVKSTQSPFDFKADLILLEAARDITPPVWSDARTNNTAPGQPTLFYVKWADNTGLSGFIFGTNNTGTWVNSTWTSMSGAVNWSNVTRTLNNTQGIVVQWRVWANDTSNNWNSTNVFSFTTLQGPIASFAYTPARPLVDEAIIFNASASQDFDGVITTYQWDFGDGNITVVSQSSVVHAFSAGGNYTVTLTVTDNDSYSKSTSQAIRVGISPIALFSHTPDEPIVNSAVVFNASGSYDTDGTIASYTWNFGDGNVSVTSNPIIIHVYDASGSFMVSLEVVDNEGHNGSFSEFLTIAVHDVAVLSVSPSATEVPAGQQVNIIIVVRNKGTTTETFNVTIYYNNNRIETQHVQDLPPNSETTLTVLWNTTGLTADSSYTLRAEISQITGETNTTDNNSLASVRILPQQSSPSDFWSVIQPYVFPISAVIGSALLLTVVTLRRRSNGKTASSIKPATSQLEPFEDAIGGELPEAFSVMIIGDTSSGKSVLCQQLAYRYLAQGKPCTYITYDCFPDEVRKNMKSFGWDVSAHEQNGNFVFVDCYSSIAGKTSQEKYFTKQAFSLSELGMVVSTALNRADRRSCRVFLDSTAPLFTRLDSARVTEFLQDHGAQIKGNNGIFLFVVGRGTLQEDLRRRLEEIVDCIIDLDAYEEKKQTVRRIRVRKIRGRSFSDQWISFKIEVQKGLVLFTPRN
jgi:KaiC/GvpD/RAD55 family RecA-like ATPase